MGYRNQDINIKNLSHTNVLIRAKVDCVLPQENSWKMLKLSNNFQVVSFIMAKINGISLMSVQLSLVTSLIFNARAYLIACHVTQFFLKTVKTKTRSTYKTSLQQKNFKV